MSINHGPISYYHLKNGMIDKKEIEQATENAIIFELVSGDGSLIYIG